jgi:hypothetical protein
MKSAIERAGDGVGDRPDQLVFRELDAVVQKRAAGRFAAGELLDGILRPRGGASAYSQRGFALSDGRAEQAPDAVGEGQAERAADDDAQHGAAHVAAAQVGAEGTGQGEGDEDGDERHRDPQAGRRQQDGEHRQQRTADE